ncbi:hypothetical protein E0H93_34745 [Rhizobium leguminosarum bv. viciae]|uniref:Uncharacterized protein n=1 Tax=Rhizobium esperanzae TaxID=1967781 RepID=A0A7W6UJB5_9HYPH|nr:MULTISPECIES: hypothetical protein [Rhizobium]MBB4438137.1 hypothetical protein [Rhizobium esperanzae]MBY5530211.1 hypothetical protein [Rhizobium leguminosarum]MDH6200958.1 hypothetical protein [Rhizobium leguminosarum]TBY30682.1 hypothetical protein E0H55_20595 [Rhizobium leguminosarum bv. viciae]TBY35708.1 hypothetical protein E0H60_22790 [Rhizobium leguminosarum bv. viciae]
MKREKITAVDGDLELSVEIWINDESRLHDYGIPRSAWFRGLRIMRKYGSEKALDELDRRAFAAFGRGNVRMSYRLRDLMIVIHAMEEDEVMPNDRVH